MGKIIRRASQWWERKFKYGDTQYPDPEYADPRYQNKIRNRSRSYYCEKLDPRTMKTIHWAEYGTWYKAYSKRVARRAAKILILKETLEMMAEEARLEQEFWKEREEWDPRWDLQFSIDEYWADRLQEEQERLYALDEEETDYSYSPYDWDYDHGFYNHQ